MKTPHDGEARSCSGVAWNRLIAVLPRKQLHSECAGSASRSHNAEQSTTDGALW